MSGDEGSTGPDGTRDDDLDRLRRLLIGLEGAEFEALVRTIRDPGQRTSIVAEVLSEAVAKRASSDESLGDMLAPTIEGALHRSIDRNPEPIANAIYPVIGPSVRKAITSALADMVTALNRTVEQQFSPRALRWRIEAWRAGLTYTEYLFANNINYTIDHAFLLHRETSLLLQHVAADPEFEADPDMVSSMLSAMSTALSDFMHDSFQSDAEAGRRSWTVDEQTIFVEAGEHAVVALVTRGQPPAAKLSSVTDFVDKAHVQYREALRGFEGDASVFAALRPQLEDLLRVSGDGASDASDGEARSGPPAWPFALVSVIFLLLIGAWTWRDWQFGAEARALRGALDAAPGYVLLASPRDGDHLVVDGLRDSLAADFEALRAEHAPSLDVEARFRPWFSAEADIVQRRLLRDIGLPDGAEARLEGDRLILAGIAEGPWLERARTLAAATEGVAEVDVSGLVVARSPEQQLQGMAAVVEGERLFFDRGESALDAQQRATLEDIAASLQATLDFGFELGQSQRILVIGQSDSTGGMEVNRRLSRARRDRAREPDRVRRRRRSAHRRAAHHRGGRRGGAPGALRVRQRSLTGGARP